MRAPPPSRSQQGNAVMQCALPPPRTEGISRAEPLASWYPGWQLAVAWLLTVILAGLIYFVPVTTLLESVSDHSGMIAAATDGP
jgi:hypothetical protein